MMNNNDKQLQSQLSKLKVQAPSAYAVQNIIKKSRFQPNTYMPTEIITLSLFILPKKMILLFILILGIIVGWSLTNDVVEQDPYLFSNYQQGVFYE